MTVPHTLTLALLLGASSVLAQTDDPLKAAAQKAIQTNPEVTARFNAYRAAGNEIDVARGAYYPRVDLSADVGRSRDSIDSRIPKDQNLSRTGVGVSLTQLLWDGRLTQTEVSRLGHARSSRYFEFVDATEQTALEASRAYYDVLRFRRLVQLAEDNYVQHKLSHDQIQNRFKAGVGRGVDVEQAAARLALAETNLSTEVSNLHDVVARYQRVVGEAPPAQAVLGAGLTQGLPATATDAQTQATLRNASVSAAVESLRALRSQSEGQRSAFQPRIEARARGNEGHNLNGLQDQQREAAAEVVLSWNLFNGGSDQARVRQFADLVTQAADLRDRACRDTRQTAAIAFNDTGKLVEQLRYLERNVTAIEHARDAYRQQFEIGQRSLLDLLNAENEVYTSRRAYANAEHELRIAYVRTHAATNKLTAALGLSRIDTGALPDGDWRAGEDAAARCPIVDTPLVTTPRSELDARAKALAEARPGTPSTAPAPKTPASR
ncbi:TolC family outer membrane protein [Methylibium sp.]|uniref:TolC family outer membrane protein n=1 Tax=Methylibium sp. TaxID=2067992 RepID=UPI003D116D3B